MKAESTISPVLFWPSKSTRGDSLYQSARREILRACGQMPRTVHTDPDIPEFFAKNPETVLYLPVCVGDTGWWGGLLGTDPKSGPRITDKIILSAECQLMVVKSKPSMANTQQSKLLVAEIYPSSLFFKKVNSQVATALDMLATDAGMILGLFVGKNQKKFAGLVESTGNSYLGCVGYY